MPFAALGLALGRVGCLLGGCDYGAPVAAGSPWPRIAYPSWSRREPRLGLLGAPAFVDHLRAGLLPPGATRSLPVHPVPVYWIFTLIPLGILLLLWPPGLRVLGRPLPASLLFALAYAGLTWTLEPLRGDPDRGLVGGHSLAEWGTGLLAAAGLAAWIDGRLVAPVLLAAAVFVADALALRLAWRRAGRPGWRWILNPGAAAGLLAGCPGLHVAVTAACLGAALLWLSLGGAQSDAALGLFCGGAAANLHHRVRFGGVVDYWPLPASPWVVSLGDIALTAALLWLLGAAL